MTDESLAEYILNTMTDLDAHVRALGGETELVYVCIVHWLAEAMHRHSNAEEALNEVVDALKERFEDVKKIREKRHAG